MERRLSDKTVEHWIHQFPEDKLLEQRGVLEKPLALDFLSSSGLHLGEIRILTSLPRRFLILVY